MIDVALAFILSWLFVYLVYISHAPNLFKITISIIALFVAGKYVERKLKPQRELVFYLWKSKRGLKLMNDYTRKFSPYIRFMLDIYMFVAFGVLALFLMRWRSVKERLLLLIPGYLLLFLVYLIYPYVMSVLAVMLGLSMTSSSANYGLFLLLFGVSPSITLALFASALNIAYLLIQKYIFGSSVVVKQAATLLLPGINIPFLEGIIALALILVIHEFSHGIAGIMEKIRITSLGIITFGTLPIGAFVEPDEKQLSKAKESIKSRVAIAGVGSNFVASLIGVILLMLFLLLFPSSSCLSFKNNVPVVSSLDSCTSQSLLLEHSFLTYYSNPIMAFIYNTLVLFTSLNLIVGVVNLLPFPFFDGNLLYYSLLPKWLAKLSEWIAIFSLVVSILPSLL